MTVFGKKFINSCLRIDKKYKKKNNIFIETCCADVL